MERLPLCATAVRPSPLLRVVNVTIQTRAVQSQRLLVPVVVEATAGEIAWFESAREALLAEGLAVEPFGPNALAVHAIPAILARLDPKKLVRVLAVGDEPGAAPLHELVAERFHSMACRSAVMSGDRLTEAEIGSLLATAATLEHPHNCPHGRPTVLTFSSAELERYFRRRC